MLTNQNTPAAVVQAENVSKKHIKQEVENSHFLESTLPPKLGVANDTVQLSLKPHDGQLVIDSRIVAKCLELEHGDFVKNILQKYSADIERLGVFRFQNGKPKSGKGGRPEVFAYLNEAQASFVATLSRNSKAVVGFKLALAKAATEFYREQRNPDLAVDRATANYQRKGKDNLWIARRFSGIATRKGLTTTLAAHGVKGEGFAECTNASRHVATAVTKSLNAPFA